MAPKPTWSVQLVGMDLRGPAKPTLNLAPISVKTLFSTFTLFNVSLEDGDPMVGSFSTSPR